MMTHEGEGRTISQIIARPYKNDSRLLDDLQKRADLEVFAIPNGGICLLDREFATINSEPNTTVIADADDTLFKSMIAEQALRESLFGKENAALIGTGMYNAMRKSLHPRDQIGGQGIATIAGVFDTQVAKGILAQYDFSIPFRKRMRLAKKELRLAKRVGTYDLRVPIQMSPEDFPGPYEFADSLLNALSDVTGFRPVVFTYGDPMAQVEKVLPLLLMKKISGAIIVADRKNHALDYMIQRPNSPLAKKMSSWVNRSDGRLLYISEDQKDISNVLNSFKSIADQRYGLVVSPKGAWSTRDYVPNRTFETGIAEISFMNKKPTETELRERISTHLNGSCLGAK